MKNACAVLIECVWIFVSARFIFTVTNEIFSEFFSFCCCCCFRMFASFTFAGNALLSIKILLYFLLIVAVVCLILFSNFMVYIYFGTKNVFSMYIIDVHRRRRFFFFFVSSTSTTTTTIRSACLYFFEIVICTRDNRLTKHLKKYKHFCGSIRYRI